MAKSFFLLTQREIQALDVIADTVAMSKPHEIEYKITFDSSTIKAE